MMKRNVHKRSFKMALFFALILILSALLVAGCSDKPTTTSGSGGEPAKTDAAKETAAPSGDKGSAAQANNTSIAKSECSECHEMWPEIATWQTSVHAKVACTVCHTGYNPSQNKSSHDSGAFQKPIRIKNPVSDDACNSCHAMENRNETLLPDLIAPHKKHAAANVSCLECHRFTTHGNIGERKVTTRDQYSDYNKWNPQVAQQAAPGVHRRPNMFVCINCHESRKVTTACAACHYWEDRKSLPSHEDQQWLVVHGKNGRQDIDNCAKCHYDKESEKFVTPSTGDKIADFARANSYCYGCHLKRPPNHDAQWMPKHSKVAGERGLLNCFACHDREQPRPNVTGTYCNTCHWFQVPAAPAPAAATPAAPASAEKKE
ncbi:MAG: hypothetical protein CVU89_13375 [Firmicutes bacterium HGW-Firmicutes-14]|nr:MAG: hypothetical protein CVU89_13375 [Firmicutes bacterium HGW-Firmicutes-14]